MKKFAPKGRVVEFGRGYVQTKISGAYLNKSGKTEEVELDEKLDKEDEPKVKEIIKVERCKSNLQQSSRFTEGD